MDDIVAGAMTEIADAHDHTDIVVAAGVASQRMRQRARTLRPLSFAWKALILLALAATFYACARGEAPWSVMISRVAMAGAVAAIAYAKGI